MSVFVPYLHAVNAMGVAITDVRSIMHVGCSGMAMVCSAAWQGKMCTVHAQPFVCVIDCFHVPALRKVISRHQLYGNNGWYRYSNKAVLHVKAVLVSRSSVHFVPLAITPIALQLCMPNKQSTHM